MQHYFRSAGLWACLVAPLWGGHTTARAEPTQSLAEKRLGFIKGTTPGIVLFDFGSAVPRAAASGPAVNAPAVAQASKNTETAVVTPSEQPIGNRLFSNLPPPSGKSLQSARRLDAPDQGVPLRTSRDAVQPPKAEPAAKR